LFDEGKIAAWPFVRELLTVVERKERIDRVTIASEDEPLRKQHSHPQGFARSGL
jgi:hypothetical protein